jgi:hypothetical protein
MIARGMDGTFYEIPDDKTEEYKIPPEELKEKMEAACKDLPNVPMGFFNIPMGAPMQPMRAPMQPMGGPVAPAAAGGCYSCQCYCDYCYCYRCYYYWCQCYVIYT